MITLTFKDFFLQQRKWHLGGSQHALVCQYYGHQSSSTVRLRCEFSLPLWQAPDNSYVDITKISSLAIRLIFWKYLFSSHSGLKVLLDWKKLLTSRLHYFQSVEHDGILFLKGVALCKPRLDSLVGCCCNS